MIVLCALCGIIFRYPHFLILSAKKVIALSE